MMGGRGGGQCQHLSGIRGASAQRCTNGSKRFVTYKTKKNGYLYGGLSPINSYSKDDGR